MLTTRQTIIAGKYINIVWNFMTHVRGDFSIGDLFTPTLAILYAIHKGYGIHMYDYHRLEFKLNDDKLYRDLANLVPDDKHLHTEMCKFFMVNPDFDRDEFNSVYVEVLKGLFDLVSSNSGRQEGDFYTPSAITKLMAYIVEKEGCKNIFDPFCGTASIVHEMSQLEEFRGQELNYKTSIYARINAEAVYGHSECIANVDSIRCWDEYSYDAVVSCPPLGLRLTQAQLYEARHTTPLCPCNSFEEIILTRPFYCNNAKLTVTHLSTSFCFKGNKDYELRRDLVERNLVDTIISLPANILYGSSISSIILICKKGRNQDEPIKFIHADDYVLGERRKRTFDYERFVKMIEGDAHDIVNVSSQEIRQFDYNLNPLLYHKMDFDLKNGQKMVRLEELLTPIEGDRIPSNEVKDHISINSLSRDFIEIRINNGKLSDLSEIKRKLSYREIKASEDKYLLTFSSMTDKRYGINTEGNGFVYPVDIKVYKININLVTPEYLAYILVNNKAINKGGMPLSGYMMLPIVIDSLADQKEIVNKISQKHAATVRAEREADEKRLGVMQNVSDLEHMLQTTYANIDNIIYKLENKKLENSTLHSLVKGLKDNVEYLKRVIQYDNANISSKDFNLKEQDIEKFIKDYCNSWINYSGNYFSLSLKTNLGDNKIVMFDKALFKVMLDSILTNVERHGFDKRRSDNNHVEISLSIEKYENKAFVVIRVANNGSPFKNGFTIKDYITRGRYSANTGRSGLGGYHVYSIIKGHGGFLYIDFNKIWNVIIELLVPINNVETNNIVEYENECI